ncbi:rhodanese-related sulfurtransferase [Jejuia pallidilutea]|jgi:rhodanese-related sulfurtransferase|uniref:Rhodanese-related sulfurtransferase n=1 Tax=Jejuia pallidilutea TaxID=504487 RepID=A0A362X9G1_9FLAO|nr:rhodanese-like domain-containing protein [Jejuia pallidilutea]PQV50389.1 rhodanese-related sulfurtransferase [Jejuia pallidilutea]
MKKTPFFLLVLSICATVLFSSFTSLDNVIEQDNNTPPDEFEILLNYLKSNNAFINGESLPIIMADEVRKNIKNPKFHLIDIRTEAWFEYGHIKNAANVKPENLLTYFETSIKPQDFDKIVLICYSGQSAAYYSSLLRLAGYNNVHSMKWGMSSWREDFADNAWNKNIKNDYATKLETTEKTKPEHTSHPKLNTGKTEAKEILKARLETLFATPYKEYIIKSIDIFENPDNYYIINYWDEDKCTGHIPGTLHFQPNASFSDNLLTLPTNEKIVVYEATGQKAAYIVAYLNVLGYNAGNLAYGANSFMNELLKEHGLDAFSKKEINMFPVIE